MTALKDLLKDQSAKTALILGSGLGGVVEAMDITSRHPYDSLDGFPESGVSGHSSELIVGILGKTPVIVLSGRVHYYERGDAAAMRGPLEALKAVGVENIVLTNSAGSVNVDFEPGSVMQIKDHINFSGTNPLIGEESDARFTGMTSAYDKKLRRHFRKAAKTLDIELHRGVYMWFSGPSFETPAEIKMARRFGADTVGMSTVPEVILSRFLGLRVTAFSVITNFGAGMTGNELSHGETKEMAPKGGAILTRLLTNALTEDLPK